MSNRHRIYIPDRQESSKSDADDIIYIEGMKNYIKLVTLSGM